MAIKRATAISSWCTPFPSIVLLLGDACTRGGEATPPTRFWVDRRLQCCLTQSAIDAGPIGTGSTLLYVFGWSKNNAPLSFFGIVDKEYKAHLHD
jgi:hypothetical protein